LGHSDLQTEHGNTHVLPQLQRDAVKRVEDVVLCRGRDAGCPAPPAQIRTCRSPGCGSYRRRLSSKRKFGYQKEFNKYKQMGEIAYVQSMQEQAFQFVRDSPREFMKLIAKRVIYFWDGSGRYYLGAIPWHWLPSSYLVVSILLLPALLIALLRNLLAWQLFFGAVLLYPLPYDLTLSQVRYRQAIEPIILLPIANAGVEAADRFDSFFRSSGARAGWLRYQHRQELSSSEKCGTLENFDQPSG
jgi:hypothetical protein